MKRSGLTYDQLEKDYSLNKDDAKRVIDDLRNRGYTVGEYARDGELVYQLDTFIQPPSITKRHIPNEFTFAIISDTHFGSKYAKIEELKQFYDIIDARGIKHVDHVGDMIDGLNVYKGQISELKCCTLDDQIDLVVNEFPHKKNIETDFIIGNHDFSFVKSVGIDVGKLISQRRSDMKYLGQFTTILDFGGIKLELVHYTGSMAWGISYRAQKYLRDYIGRSPAMLALGHAHKQGFFLVRNTYCFEAGNFQGPTPLCKEKGLFGVSGGWIVNITQENGRIIKIVPEWIEFK